MEEKIKEERVEESRSMDWKERYADIYGCMAAETGKKNAEYTQDIEEQDRLFKRAICHIDYLSGSVLREG